MGVGPHRKEKNEDHSRYLARQLGPLDGRDRVSARLPGLLQPRRDRRARARSSKIDGSHARRRPTATSAARCGGSIAASTATSACCIPPSAPGRKGPRRLSSASTWDEALDLIATKMREARDRSAPRPSCPTTTADRTACSRATSRTRGSSGGSARHDWRARSARRRPAPPPTAMYGKMAGVALRRLRRAPADRRLGLQSVGVRHSPRLAHQTAQKDGAQGSSSSIRGGRRSRARPISTCRCGPAPICRSRSPSSASCSSRATRTRRSSTGTPDGADELRARAAELDDRARGRGRRRRRAKISRRSPSGTARRRPPSIRCGWGQERNRNGGPRRWRCSRCRRSAASSACAAAATR